MAEKCIELDSVEIAAAVFGNCDRNIRLSLIHISEPTRPY